MVSPRFRSFRSLSHVTLPVENATAGNGRGTATEILLGNLSVGRSFSAFIRSKKGKKTGRVRVSPVGDDKDRHFS